MRYCIFDTETTGKAPAGKTTRYDSYTNSKAYDNSRMIELAWGVYDDEQPICEKSYLIKPEGYYHISEKNQSIHGISSEMVENNGVSLRQIIGNLFADIFVCDKIVGHNVWFDLAILKSEIYRFPEYRSIIDYLYKKPVLCTLRLSR